MGRRNNWIFPYITNVDPCAVANLLEVSRGVKFVIILLSYLQRWYYLYHFLYLTIHNLYDLVVVRYFLCHQYLEGLKLFLHLFALDLCVFDVLVCYFCIDV